MCPAGPAGDIANPYTPKGRCDWCTLPATAVYAAAGAIGCVMPMRLVAYIGYSGHVQRHDKQDRDALWAHRDQQCHQGTRCPSLRSGWSQHYITNFPYHNEAIAADSLDAMRGTQQRQRSRRRFQVDELTEFTIIISLVQALSIVH